MTAFLKGFAESAVRPFRRFDAFFDDHLLRKNRPDWIVFGVILLFYALKAWFHRDVLCGEYEEYLKIKFTLSMSGISFFMPWAGNGGHFYGHPGLMNLMYYLWSRFLGYGMESVRMFCLTISALLPVMLYLTIDKTLGKKIAFFSTLTVIAMPLFQVESILFLFEIGSYTLAFASLFFYFKRIYWAYALLAAASFLYLESALAFAAGVFVYHVFAEKSGLLKQKGTLFWMLFPFVVTIGFFLIKSRYDLGGNHITHDLVVRRLLNPLLIFREVNFDQLWQARWYTLKESLPDVFIWGAFLVYLKALVFHREVFKKPFMIILGVAALLQFLFGSFLSEEMGGSDFYAGFFYMFVLLYLTLQKGKGFVLVSLASLTAVSLNSIHELHFGGLGWTQTSLEEYQRIEEGQNIRQSIELVSGGPFRCYLSEFTYHPYFCSDFFELKPGNIETVKSMEESNVLIMSPEDEYNLQLVLDKDLVVYQGPFLGRIHRRDLYLYFIQ